MELCMGNWLRAGQQGCVYIEDCYDVTSKGYRITTWAGNVRAEDWNGVLG